MRPAAAPAMLAAVIAAALAAMLAAAVPGAARAGTADASIEVGREAGREVGRDLYEGRHPALLASTVHGDAAAPVPARQAACIACHRPSGLGSYEGGAAVPPIGSGLLAAPFDPATTRRYDPAGRGAPGALRVRPAYDAGALHRLLTEGRTPDGRDIGTLMPRYRIEPAHSAALLAHLNQLGTGPTPGVEAEVVHFATITSDELPAAQAQELLAVLRQFIERKNALTRGEERRRASALRNEHTMYARYRRWALHHWVLRGEPATWGAQLEAAYRAQPVFAVLSGRSTRPWQPVHEFCERERLPCLFPITAWPGDTRAASGGFYSAYFSGGVPAQARWLAGELSAPAQPLQAASRPGAAESVRRRWLVLSGPAPAQLAAAERVATILRERASGGGGDSGGGGAEGPAEVAVSTAWQGERVVVSLLAPQQVQQALARAGPDDRVAIYLLAGEARPQPAAPGAAAQAAASSTPAPPTPAPSTSTPSSPAPSTPAQSTGAPPAWPAGAAASWVTQQAPQAAALARARAAWRSLGLAPGDEAQAAQVLLAATAAVETLVHVDERFSREYCLEKLEHTLENLPPLTAYPRLALAPGQRLAAKAVWLLPLAPPPAAVLADQGMPGASTR